MSNCRDIENDLSALINGELPGERRAEVIEHVDHCPQCAQRVAELQKLVTGIAALPAAQFPPQFLADVRRKLRQDERSLVDTLFRPVWWKVPLEAMAAVLVVAGIFAVSQSGQRPPLAKPEAPIAKSGVTAKILQSEPADKADAGNRIEHMGALRKEGAVPTAPIANQPQVAGATVGAPPELPDTIEISGDSIVAVRLRVENLAKHLDGRVESAAPTNEFLVYLPQSKLAAFRSQVAGSQAAFSYAVPAQPEASGKVERVVGVKVRVKP